MNTTKMQHWGKCVPCAIECKSTLCDIACGGRWNMQPEMYRYIISCICYIENCAKACHNCAYSMNMRSVCSFTREQVMHCRDCCNQCAECCVQTIRLLRRESQSCVAQMSTREKDLYVGKYETCVRNVTQLVEECQQCIRECDMVLAG